MLNLIFSFSNQDDLFFHHLLGELIKPGDTKCVLNEGMPMHRRPFEKGRLIIHFSVRCFSVSTPF